MEQIARTPSGPGEFQPLNPPTPLGVKVSTDDYPSELQVGGDWLGVVSVDDMWRIDDEWWREKPVGRLYFRLLTCKGTRLTVFRDLLEDKWYRQNDE